MIYKNNRCKYDCNCFIIEIILKHNFFLSASIVSILFVGNLYTPCFSQGVWIQKANYLGVTKFVAAGFSIGTKGYIGTGRDLGSGSGFTKDFWEWDQASNTWTQKADFGGTDRMAAVGFSIGTKGYIGTGWDVGLVFTKDFWEWNQATNTWTKKADFAGPGRYRAAGFSIGTKGYIGTGYDGGMYYTDFWEWDQASNTWTQKADFGGVARLSAASFSIGTKGYMGTGGDGNSVVYKDFWEWDQASNTWTQKADFGGSSRIQAGGFSIGTCGYISAGDSGATAYNDLWSWDQTGNTWTQMADFGTTGKAGPVCFSIMNFGYIGTGWGTVTDDFWEYSGGNCSVVPPILSLTSNQADILCKGKCTGTATVTPSNGTSPYKYFWSNGKTTQTVSGLCEGNYTVTVSDVNGWSGSNTITIITLFASPTAYFTYQPQSTSILNPAIQFTDSSIYNISSWLWNFGDPESGSSSLQNPGHTYTDTGKYIVKLIVTDIHGCTDTIEHSIFITPDYIFYAPNGFTPNNDGINDVFLPQTEIIISAEYSLIIFDRWGNKIFESNDYKQGWNGKVKNTNMLAQEDVYLWTVKLLDFNHGQHEYLGRVTMLK